MPGTLGTAALIANTDTKLYMAPLNGLPPTVNICFANLSREETVEAYVFITPDDIITDASCLEPGSDILPRGTLERYGVVISPGDKIWVRTNGSRVAARVHGYD